MDDLATGAPGRASRVRRLLPWIVLGGVALVLLVVWLRVDWAWSPVDDGGHATALRALIHERGLLGGMGAYSAHLFNSDLSWGLFRPSYWAYPSFLYLLEPAAAHVVRLAMLALAVGGPLIHLHRSGVRGARLTMTGLLLAAAASSLYIGLFLVSLQELSALALIGLGLLLRGRWTRWVAWTLAAWFKAPFAWLLLGQAVADWRRGARRLAVANAATGLLTLALAALMARGGAYTARYALDPFAIWFNAQHLIEPMNALLLVSVLWWLAVTRSRMAWSGDAIVFGIGWAGYTAQLLPWGVTAYYMGPISFLLGLLLVSMLGATSIRGWRAAIALAVPGLIALYLVITPLRQGFAINDAMATFQRCLAAHPGSTSVMQGQVMYVTTSEEGPIRLVQNLQLADPSWQGTITLVDPAAGTLPDGADYLLHAGDPMDPVPDGLRVVCAGASAQVYGR